MTEEHENLEQILTVPHSRAAEEGLLGSLLIDPEALSKIALDPEDFYIIRNRWIYQAMIDLMRQGQPVDYITICTYLDSQKRLKEIGGPAYVMSLVTATPSSLNLQGYAEIVSARAKRRRIIAAANKLATVGYDMDSDLGAGIAEAMDALARSVISAKGAMHIKNYVSQIYDEVKDAIADPQEVYGISTGFADWDRITYGLQKGEKVLLSGEPGVGKSVLAAQVLIHAALCGHPGVLYELEMSGRQVVRRALAAHSKAAYGANITTQKMRQGKLTDEEIPIFTRAVEAMGNLPVYISDASELTTAELRADVLKLKEDHGIELVMIDYEGLLGDAPDKDENVRSKLISKRTHDIAKDLDVAMIAIGDMTKEGIKQTVRGQGAVAGTARSLHDADQIIIIRKGDDENMVRMTWEKMREGEGDRFIDLYRVQGFPMFGEVKR